MLWVKSTGCLRFGDFTETGIGDSAGQGFGGLFAPDVRDPWRGRGVYDTRDGGLSLASFRSVSKISMPTTTAGSLRVETVVTGETHQCLEHGMERMLRNRQEKFRDETTFGDYFLHGQNLGVQPEALYSTCASLYET